MFIKKGFFKVIAAASVSLIIMLPPAAALASAAAAKSLDPKTDIKPGQTYTGAIVVSLK